MAGRNGLAGFEVATALIIVEVLGQTCGRHKRGAQPCSPENW
jgi:hypothetical protein